MRKIIALIVLASLIMGTVVFAQDMHTRWVNRKNLVYWSTHQNRWLDAYGEGVVKFIHEFTIVPIGADNADPLGWVMTAIAGDAGDATLTAGVTHSGEMICGTDSTENDGFNLYVDGEAFKLEANKPCYFGMRLKSSDADATDLIVGLATIDTGIWANVPNDIVYFHSADAVAVFSFSTGKDSTYTTDASAGTLEDNTYSILEFYWDGSTYIHAYFDGVLVASSSTNLPDNEALTPHIELLTGESNMNTVTIDWMRVIQCR